jgi:hypothetical protein
MAEAIQKITPIDAINEFYKLKDKYKSGYYDKYIKPIINNEKKSKREKRVEYSKLPKPECINCKRNVETIFTITNDYSARRQYYESIKDGLEEIEKLKLAIIKEKNNALFFEKQNDTISNFEKLTDSLKNETELTGILIEQDILKNDNPVKTELLKTTIDEFGKAFLIPFKKMVSEYIDTSNELILNQAITFYVDEMVPKVKEIQTLRYDVSFIDYNQNKDQYTLIQRPNSIENKEHMYEEDDKVIKFITGMPKITKTKTKKVTNTITAKNKTKKNMVTLELVDELPEEPGQGQGPVPEPGQVAEPVPVPGQVAVPEPVVGPGQVAGQGLQLKFKDSIVDINPRYEGQQNNIEK